MPALALADAIRQRWSHVHVDFIGAQRGLEATLLPQRGEQVQLLMMHAIQGQGWLSRVRVLGWELPRAVFSIIRAWRTNKPDVLVGVGGYASVSGVLAAVLCRVPVVLYEQNAIPGMVNRTLARFCHTVMLGFAEAAPYLPKATCVVTGNGVRDAIAAVQCSPHIPPRLLVMGGSQGARFLNQTIPLLCAELRRQKQVFQVHHICGKAADIASVQAAYATADVNAEVIAFCDDMAEFYRQGDLLIARAGAMTVSEVTICGLPTVFIPLPSAADQHQYHNAESLRSCGAALLWQQQDYDLQTWVKQLQQTLFNPLTLLEMRQFMRAAARPEAQQQQLHVLATWLEE
jgi:UDP-N-acetylglucosamine--N-acetylmuramyl-(pentapeptide) pyrophosphoryl-undecaprenol N-acetylglucosamine transferase